MGRERELYINIFKLERLLKKFQVSTLVRNVVEYSYALFVDYCMLYHVLCVYFHPNFVLFSLLGESSNLYDVSA